MLSFAFNRMSLEDAPISISYSPDAQYQFTIVSLYQANDRFDKANSAVLVSSGARASFTNPFNSFSGLMQAPV